MNTFDEHRRLEDVTAEELATVARVWDPRSSEVAHRQSIGRVS